jgi:hypothetical protein
LQLYTFLEDLMRKQEKQRGQPGGDAHKGPAALPPERHPACRKQSGQSAVEFALVVSIAIILFLGMMQFGMYLFGLSIVENSARNGARQGSVSQSCSSCDATAAAQSALQGQPVIRNASVAVLAPGGVVGSTVKIRVTADIPMIVPGGNTLLYTLSHRNQKIHVPPAYRHIHNAVRQLIETVNGKLFDLFAIEKELCPHFLGFMYPFD